MKNKKKFLMRVTKYFLGKGPILKKKFQKNFFFKFNFEKERKIFFEKKFRGEPNFYPLKKFFVSQN